MTRTGDTDSDAVQAVLRLRTLGPSGLNPPQTEVLDRLQQLTQSEESQVTNLDIDVWDGSGGITRTDDHGTRDTREKVAEFTRWADEHGCTLRPAFDWRSTETTDAGHERQQVVTPLITLAVYDGGRLQAVYPHVDDGVVRTVHDGLDGLESTIGKGDAEQPDDERRERAAPLR